MSKSKIKMFFSKNKKTSFIVIISILLISLGFGAFLYNTINNSQNKAKALSLAAFEIYQVNLNPVNLNIGQVYDLNTSNIKFRSTNPYYSINVDYTYSTPGQRRVFAKLKGLGSNSYYPISSLCINDQLSQEKISGSGSFSGSGMYSGSGLFRTGGGNGTNKVAITVPYFWNNNNPASAQCRTSNTNYTSPEYQFTNYNYKAFDLPDNQSAVISITQLPSEQIDSREIIYFITSLPQKSTIYLSGKAESDYLINGYNFRFSNPSEAGNPSTPTPCQRSTYFYLNTNVIDCFTQKDLESGKVKIKVSNSASTGADQIKLVAFDKFHTKAFDYNYNVISQNTSGGTSISFIDNQPSLNNNNTATNSNSAVATQNGTNTSINNNVQSSSPVPQPEEIKINPENLPFALKSKFQNSDTELVIDAVLAIKKKLTKGVTNFNFTVSKIQKTDQTRSESDFKCELFADNVYRGDKNKPSSLISNSMTNNSCIISFVKDKTKKYNRSAKFYVKITDSKTGHVYITNKISVTI